MDTECIIPHVAATVVEAGKSQHSCSKTCISSTTLLGQLGGGMEKTAGYQVC